jgi:hypothetical protein
MSAAQFDRSAEDLGNIVWLEHCNMQIPDQRLATVFYVEGLGLTRDPYMHVTDANMWVNVGRNQFHMPNRRPTNVFRATIGLVVPHLDLVRSRMPGVQTKLEGTRFTWQDEGETLRVTCPWGNRLRVHAPGQFGRMELGIPYVDFPVARGCAEGIVRFYRQVMKVPARLVSTDAGTAAWVKTGLDQHLIFSETDQAIEPYDGHHIAVYVADFSGPYKWLLERRLVTEESDRWQYRFETICDPLNEKPLFEIQHEVRSLSHPMFPRHFSLVNRNPRQSQGSYAPGRDSYYPR